MEPGWDLEMRLLCMPSTGGSVSEMQGLANDILQCCDNVPQHVKEIAALGGGSHTERNLHRWVAHQPWRALLPQAYDFEIAVTLDGGVHETTVEHSAFLPHEMVASLSECTELVSVLFAGRKNTEDTPGALEEYWSKVAHTKWMQSHPLLGEIQRQPNLCFPFGIHGDDAGVFLNQKVLVLTFGSVAVEEQTLDTRILFTSVPIWKAVPGKTLNEVYKVFVWSLNYLQLGVWPHEDHTGKPFSRQHHPERFEKAGHSLTSIGLKGIWTELRGDWKWQWEALALPSFYNSNYICHLCRAHKKIRRLLYTDFRRDAQVRKTCVSWPKYRDWLAEAGDERPEITRLIGFDIWRCVTDAMHNLDLGVYQVVAASCLVELISEGVWPGDSNDERYAAAHHEYKGWCRARGLQPCPPFKGTTLNPGGLDTPSFTMHQAKGAQMKYIMMWLHTAVDRGGAADAFHGAMRFGVIDQFVRFEKACDTPGKFLTPLAQKEVADAVENALVCLNALASEAIENRSFFWAVSPKDHMTTHLAYDFAGDGVNPRRTTCYSDEDMVGRVKRITRACHGATATMRSLDRYAILVGTRWWARVANMRFNRQ